MPKSDPWFVSERAYAIAALLLTSRNDLIVRQQYGNDGRVDMLVEVLKNKKHTMRVFGVQLKGFVSLPDLNTADKWFVSSSEKNRTEYSLPLCACLIDVKKKDTYFRWIVEPQVTEGEPHLIRPDAAEWKSLTEKNLDEIVTPVNEWYDAIRPVAQR
jgi:hypothetical protein